MSINTTQELLRQAQALSDEPRAPEQTTDCTPVRTRVRVFLMPTDRTMQQVVVFISMMIAHAFSARNEGSSLTMLMSIFATVFSSDTQLANLISKTVAVTFDYIPTAWADTNKKIIICGNALGLNLKAQSKEHEPLVALLVRQAEVAEATLPDASVTDAVPSAARPFLFRQIIFCFAKASSNRSSAVAWAGLRIGRLVDAGRAECPKEYRLSTGALEVIVNILATSLVARGMIVEVLMKCMTSKLTDEVMTAMGQQAMYLRNVGMTPLMIVKRYAIDAGYPEMQGEHGLGAELKAYIQARQVLISGGLRAAFMYFVQSPATAIMHPNNFPKLFSFALGAGQVEEASLADYVTSVTRNEIWYNLGESAAKARQDSISTANSEPKGE